MKLLNNKELQRRQITNSSELIGKTILAVVDAGEVLIQFTDGTFAVINPDPEGEGCGLNCSPYTMQELDDLAKAQAGWIGQIEEGRVLNLFAPFLQNGKN